MSNDFKPYEETKEVRYKVELSKDEAIMIQKMRDIRFGSITIHMVAGKPKRVEITNSTIMAEDYGKERVTIALEVVSN